MRAPAMPDSANLGRPDTQRHLAQNFGAERKIAPAAQTSGLPVNPENRYDQFSSGLIREIPDKEAS